jgi:hypothetical protein
MSLFPGDGTGALGPETSVPVAQQTIGMGAADFDADGHVDLLTRTDDSNGQTNPDWGRVLFGDGDGSFGDAHLVPSPVTLDGSPGVIADLDGDGKPDYARTTDTGTVQVLMNRWSGRPS